MHSSAAAELKLTKRRDGLITIWEASLWGTLFAVSVILICLLCVWLFQTCHTKYLRWQGRRRRNRAKKARRSMPGEESEMVLKKLTGPITTNATRENKCSEIKENTQQKLAVPKEKQKLKNLQDCNGTAVLKALSDGCKEPSVKPPEGKKAVK